MPDGALEALAGTVIAACVQSGRRLVLAESCTGGLLCASLTAVAGASAVVERGFVTYSNLAKEEELGVPGGLLAQFGAVSAETARAMAEGALARSPANLALAITGIAGPGGGSADKPVGLVWLARAARDGQPALVERNLFPGDRTAVRHAAVQRALKLLLPVAGA